MVLQGTIGVHYVSDKNVTALKPCLNKGSSSDKCFVRSTANDIVSLRTTVSNIFFVFSVV